MPLYPPPFSWNSGTACRVHRWFLCLASTKLLHHVLLDHSQGFGKSLINGWVVMCHFWSFMGLPITAPFICLYFLGKYQARILSESLLSPAEYQKEVNYELVTGKVEALGAFFSTLCPGISWSVSAEAAILKAF